MPQSLTQFYVHLIFSTKNREPWLSAEVQDKLFPYLAGALNAQDSPAIKVGGHFDHVHLLYRASKNKVPSKVVGEIKGQSSKWVKEQFPMLAGFGWQGGYGAFSVDASNVETVTQYVAKQAEHHKVVTFKEEFRRFLAERGVEYDERYVWD
ncbi:MAG: IS200/IS605 family transposase [Akkermansiaceae bacterium]|nr:IS200/IS605 family transposase [Akkermansiaceae bacterium]NNM29079.1 IS200/IS605 family transposase [Akkermansiaceae bacterium]